MSMHAAFSLAAAAFFAASAVTHAADAAQAKATFAAARDDLRACVAELTTLQADYQKPGADKPAIEAKFNATKARAQAANDRLEASAFEAIAADPNDASVLDVCGTLLAVAVQRDDPTTVLARARELDAAGVKNGDIAMMAADSAVKLSQLDDAEVWLEKAAAAGVDKQKVAGLKEAIEHDRPKVDKEMAIRAAEAKADDLPRVKITTSKGDIVVELFENEAPNTVANFVELVEKGFYDGTPFHRVIGGFMAQGGDPTGSGRGGPGYAIACECDAPDGRLHFLGTLSMAHAGKDTGGSQFFLTFVPTEHLDGKHTVFGRVIEGFDVLPKLIRTEGAPPGGEQDKIVKAVVLRKRSHPYESKKLPDPRG
jgi:cyclophilin family peptidyl-prolyl cis-trans isomerase/anti-sigma28 factor (negative regulator of flagellin synthesis)